MRVLALFLCLAGAVFASGCYSARGSGEMEFSTYDLEEFDRISLTGPSELKVTHGPFGVQVTAEDNVMPSIVVQRVGSTLELRRDIDWIEDIRPTVPVEFRVSLPHLESIQVAGSGSARAYGFTSERPFSTSVSGSGAIDIIEFRGPLVDFSVSGSGSITGTGLDARVVTTTIGGSGRVGLAGTAEISSLQITGAGFYRATHLDATDVRVEISGSGQVFLAASNELVVDMAGSGQVTYFGAPRLEQLAGDEDAVRAGGPAVGFATD